MRSFLLTVLFTQAGRVEFLLVGMLPLVLSRQDSVFINVPSLRSVITLILYSPDQLRGLYNFGLRLISSLFDL